MSELTDEQLERMRFNYAAKPSAETGRVIAVITELIVLRAERAKPTPSDEERALHHINTRGYPSRDRAVFWLSSLIASIRAEGSAERAKLEAALEGWKSKKLRTSEFFDCISAILAQPAGGGATEPKQRPGEWYNHTVSESGYETAWQDGVEWENCGQDGWRLIGRKDAGAKP